MAEREIFVNFEGTGLAELKAEEEISVRVAELGKQISDDYDGKHLTLLVALKGGFIYAADLIRELDHGRVDVEVGFVFVSSYGNTQESNREPVIKAVNSPNLADREVLIVEDIVDSGWSMQALRRYAAEQGAQSVAATALLSKPDRREVQTEVEYLGFEIPNLWVEGYGLDTAQKNRGLPFVGFRP